MIIFFVLALCTSGILVSGYIYLKKTRHQTLACPRDNPCDTVLHSRFSRTLGIPNELLGVGYFTSIFLLVMLPLWGMSPVWNLYLLFFFLVGGGLFSLYLVGLQAFVMRSWCAWCLGIAAINMTLIITLSGIPTEAFSPLLTSQKLWWVIVHNVGFILGVGSATITDIFFFRFLRDGVISIEEKETMDILTNIIWAGVALLVVSGIALFIPDHARLAVSSKFLLKVIVVGVIIFNGIILNMYIAPYMKRLSFEGTVPAKRFRRLAFALGGISFTSWYLAFFLGSLRSIDIGLAPALIGYGILLVCVVVGSQIMERQVTQAHPSVPHTEEPNL